MINSHSGGWSPGSLFLTSKEQGGLNSSCYCLVQVEHPSGRSASFDRSSGISERCHIPSASRHLWFKHNWEPFFSYGLWTWSWVSSLQEVGLCQLRFHPALPEIPFCLESEMFVYEFCFEMLNKTDTVSIHSLQPERKKSETNKQNPIRDSWLLKA